MLSDLIKRHLAATAEYHASNENDPEDEKLWNAKEDAEMAVIRCPCATIEDIRAKTSWVISDDVVQDSIMNCVVKDERVLLIFLRSLLGMPPVDIGENGP